MSLGTAASLVLVKVAPEEISARHGRLSQLSAKTQSQTLTVHNFLQSLYEVFTRLVSRAACSCVGIGNRARVTRAGVKKSRFSFGYLFISRGSIDRDKCTCAAPRKSYKLMERKRIHPCVS